MRCVVSVQAISHNQRFSSPAGVHAAGWPGFYVKSAIQLGLSLSSVHAQAQIPSIMVGGERLRCVRIVCLPYTVGGTIYL